MLKLTKKADYGLIAMTHLVRHGRRGSCSAKDLAETYGLPQEALAKILQRLARAKLLAPQRGTKGGYTLARDAGSITAFEVIQAIEGPLFLTSCTTVRGACDQSKHCTVREPLQRVSRSIEDVLSCITISAMAAETAPDFAEPGGRRPAAFDPRTRHGVAAGAAGVQSTGKNDE